LRNWLFKFIIISFFLSSFLGGFERNGFEKKALKKNDALKKKNTSSHTKLNIYNKQINKQ